MPIYYVAVTANEIALKMTDSPELIKFPGTKTFPIFPAHQQNPT
ncbi:hypothetical protein D1BOALGB6SA_2099 [Olavius sp. associated proteobacterium Delta 1]|nr:hypothetical protein D1BOALGB6SA_2099 [Olavius sp. associated proteobacterium Delta 1]